MKFRNRHLFIFFFNPGSEILITKVVCVLQQKYIKKGFENLSAQLIWCELWLSSDPFYLFYTPDSES